MGLSDFQEQCSHIDVSLLQTEEGRLKYKGGFDAAKDIVATSGPLGLYRGVLVNVLGIAPEKTIKLSANSVMREVIIGHFGYLPIAGEICAGGIAGFCQVLITNPLEVVKLKVMTSQMTAKEAIAQIQGIGDLYQGAVACIARDVTFSAVLFPLYSHLKVALAALLVGNMGVPIDAASFWADLVAGSLAAGPAALISTPADVVKTRLQQARECDNASEEAILLGSSLVDYSAHLNPQLSLASNNQLAVEPEGMENLNASFLGLMARIVKEEGPEVLFSGWFERVVRSVPQFGVTLATFDLLTTYAVNHGWLIEQATHYGFET